MAVPITHHLLYKGVPVTDHLVYNGDTHKLWYTPYMLDDSLCVLLLCIV